MKFLHSIVLLMAAVALGLTACGQRDREEASKTSDGSETFKYVPRDPSKYIKGAPVEGGDATKPNKEDRDRRDPHHGAARVTSQQ